MNVNVEQYLSPGTLSDLKNALKSIPSGRKIRLVRIPAIDFFNIMEKITGNTFMPFRPVIFDNIPIDMTESILPECVLVADDNTNISRTASKETELFKGGI